MSNQTIDKGATITLSPCSANRAMDGLITKVSIVRMVINNAMVKMKYFMVVFVFVNIRPIERWEPITYDFFMT
jgi:hypothetical protein